jgi:hypothetical protein
MRVCVCVWGWGGGGPAGEQAPLSGDESKRFLPAEAWLHSSISKEGGVGLIGPLSWRACMQAGSQAGSNTIE